MIRGVDYFYDKQQYRYLEQVVRAFSGFKYMPGSRNGQPPVLQTVPARLAQSSRMVANIMKNQSENTLLSVPAISVWQTGLKLRRDALQNVSHIDTRQVVEREFDPVTGKYTGNRGKSYTVRRLMPIPYSMEIQVDLWTSNLDQKYQLTEQINMAIGLYFDIQNSENPLDWTALTTATVEDFNLSSRSLPIGTSDEIDIATWNITIPMWITPPAEVTEQRVIEQIVTNIHSKAALPGIDSMDAMGDLLSQSVVTPENRRIRVEGGVLTLLDSGGSDTDLDGNVYPWIDLINQYGHLHPSTSQILVKTTEDIESTVGIVGTLQYDTNNPNQLLWQIDPMSLPSNTLPSIIGIVDPLTAYPGQKLEAPANGQRYLLINDIGANTQAWGTLAAKYGDIIQYANGHWQVATPFTPGGPEQYVLNTSKGYQLRFNGEDWVMALDGEYAPGQWRLLL